MKIQTIALAAALACGCVMNASAVDFGLPKLGKSSGNAEGEIKSFLQTAEEANKLTSQSVLALGEALLAKAAVQETQDKLAAAKNIADPQEREAALAKVNMDLQAQLAKVDYEAKANEIAKTNDKKQTQLVGASMYNFVLGLLKDKELVGKSTSVASAAASNPMLLTKANDVKNVATSLSGQMGNLGQIATGLQKLASKLKTVPLPTSATAAPVSAAD